MAQPVAERSPETIGRHGYLSFFSRWTAAEADDYQTYGVLRREDLSGDYSNARFAVDKIEWVMSAGIGFLLYFDSMPQGGENDVWQVPIGGGSGEIDFTETARGSRSDSVTQTPGELVMRTFSAADGDAITLSITYREKGKRSPQ